MPRNEPKVMWSGRLPGELVDQIVERAEEDGVSQADVVTEGMGEWLDANPQRPSQWERVPAHSDLAAVVWGGRHGTKEVDDVTADEVAREALERVAEFFDEHDVDPSKLIVCVQCGDAKGSVVGLSPAYQQDPEALLGDLLGFATIAAGAVGKKLRVEMDGG